MFFYSAFLRNTEHNQHTVDTRKWVTLLCLTLHNTATFSIYSVKTQKKQFPPFIKFHFFSNI